MMDRPHQVVPKRTTSLTHATGLIRPVLNHPGEEWREDHHESGGWWLVVVEKGKVRGCASKKA